MARAIPPVEIADHADHLGVRRPHRETRSLHAFHSRQVRAQRTVALVIRAFAMQVQFERRQQRREAIGILDLRLHTVSILRAQPVMPRFFRQGGREQPRRMTASHRRHVAIRDDAHTFSLR